MPLTITTTHQLATDPGYLLVKNPARCQSFSPALREFALGIEALCRFVEHESLYRVHVCVIGERAHESEPVDPRL